MTVLVMVVDAETMCEPTEEMERVLWSMESTGNEKNALEIVKHFMIDDVRLGFIRLAEVLEGVRFSFIMQRVEVTGQNKALKVKYFVKER